MEREIVSFSIIGPIYFFFIIPMSLSLHRRRWCEHHVEFLIEKYKVEKG